MTRKKPAVGQDQLEFHSTLLGYLSISFLKDLHKAFSERIDKKSFTQIFHHLVKKCLESRWFTPSTLPQTTEIAGITSFVPEMVNRLGADFRVPFSDLAFPRE